MKSVIARSALGAGRTAERLWLKIIDVIAVARQGQAAYIRYRELSRLPDGKLRGIARADLAGYCLGVAPLPREAANDGAREVPK